MTRGCRSQRAVLAYHDGSLPVAAQKRLELHLRKCARCTSELARLEETDALFSRCRPSVSLLAPDQAQELFREALLRSGAGVQPTRFGGWRWRWQAAALVLAVAASGALAIRMSGRNPVETAAGPVENPSTLTAVGPKFDEPTLSAHVVQVKHRHGSAGVARHYRGRRGLRFAHRFTTRSRRLVHRPAKDAPTVELLPSTPLDDALEPQLMVSVTRLQPLVNLIVTHSQAEVPGFARAEALEITPTGKQIVTAVTVSTCLPESQEATPEQQDQDQSDLEDQEERGDEQH